MSDIYIFHHLHIYIDMEYTNPYQYKDMTVRQADPYANAKYRIILEYLGGKKPLKILNAGCGSGELSVLLAESGHTVVGIDPAPEYIHLARRFLPRGLASRCSFKVASIEEVKDGERFDAVVATDVLEHIEDDERAANKLARTIAPGGLLILTVPAVQWLFGFHDENLGHFRRYRAGQLKKVIGKTGLIRIEKMRYFGWTLIPICVLFSKILRRPYPISSVGGSRAPLRKLLLNALLYLDTRAPLPLGTSLILFGRRIE